VGLEVEEGRSTMSITLRPRESRTLDQIRDHYQIEKELASRLRNSRREERANLYPLLYDELFRRVPLHPQLTRVLDPKQVTEIVTDKMRLLSRYLRRDTVFLELGAGDCRLALAVASHVKHVHALDVSQEVNVGMRYPTNFAFVLSNGTDIPMPPCSVDVAYSYQLMEHVHPDDALEQLSNIYRVLAHGGVYICITPNRLSGPHDVSQYFDDSPTGFHMQEYTATELGKVFRNVGFENVTALIEARKRFVELPVEVLRGLEITLSSLPRPLRMPVAQAPVLRNLLMAAVIGKKK
jgi:SAM-dependent methyltransferase